MPQLVSGLEPLEDRIEWMETSLRVMRYLADHGAILAEDLDSYAHFHAATTNRVAALKKSLGTSDAVELEGIYDGLLEDMKVIQSPLGQVRPKHLISWMRSHLLQIQGKDILETDFNDFIQSLTHVLEKGRGKGDGFGLSDQLGLVGVASLLVGVIAMGLNMEALAIGGMLTGIPSITASRIMKLGDDLMEGEGQVTLTDALRRLASELQVNFSPKMDL